MQCSKAMLCCAPLPPPPPPPPPRRRKSILTEDLNTERGEWEGISPEAKDFVRRWGVGRARGSGTHVPHMYLIELIRRELQ